MKRKENDVCEVIYVNREKVLSVQERMKPETTIQRLAETFKVLGDPTRVKILFALAQEALIAKKTDKSDLTAFVGDGINDAPVLVRADIGVAMGALGSDAAIDAADIVLMSDDPSRIPVAVKVAQKTRMVVWQNIFFAMAIHKEIADLSKRVERYKYMGTTLSVLFLYEKTAYIAHVGDGRIYRLRGGRLEQLTHDDTMAQLSVEMGYLQADEAAGHPLSHALLAGGG